MSIDKVEMAISLINQHKNHADFDGAKDERLVVLAENTLGIHFPDDYRFFLKNLGCGDIAGQEFYGLIKEDFINSGIPDAIWLTIKERQESNLPGNFVIINSTGDGDYFVLDCSENMQKKVLLWTPGIKDKQTSFKPYHTDFGEFFYDKIITALN